MRFVLVRWYISRTVGLDGGEAHVFRACGDNLICPISKGMMFPISRCDTWAKTLWSCGGNDIPSGGYGSYWLLCKVWLFSQCERDLRIRVSGRVWARASEKKYVGPVWC